MPRLSADLSYAAGLRIATSSLMTPDQKMDLLLTRHARRKLKVKLREVKVEYELSKAGMSTSKADVPTPRQSLPVAALPTCGESHYGNTECIASAEAAATSAQFASHARIRHARLGK